MNTSVQTAQSPKSGVRLNVLPSVPAADHHRARFNHVMDAATLFYGYQRRLCVKMQNADELLGHLFFNTAALEPHCRLTIYGSAAQIENAGAALVHHLSVVIAFTVAWLSEDDFDLPIVLDNVFAERDRQRRLLREGKILFDCASPVADVRRKFRVLAEEVGEVAEAIDKLERASKHGRAEAQFHLETEITHVAAVAVAWLESFKFQDSSLPISARPVTARAGMDADRTRRKARDFGPVTDSPARPLRKRAAMPATL